MIFSGHQVIRRLNLPTRTPTGFNSNHAHRLNLSFSFHYFVYFWSRGKWDTCIYVLSYKSTNTMRYVFIFGMNTICISLSKRIGLLWRNGVQVSCPYSLILYLTTGMMKSSPHKSARSRLRKKSLKQNMDIPITNTCLNWEIWFM